LVEDLFFFFVNALVGGEKLLNRAHDLGASLAEQPEIR
jgi:hypothetical protein